MEIIKHTKHIVKQILPAEYNDYVNIQGSRSDGNVNHSRFTQDIQSYGHKMNYTDNIIDVGCRGNAKVLIDLMNIGYENVYGIDIGYEAENMWKNLIFSLQEKLKRHDVHDGIGFDLKFNIITSSHTLEHCYDPDKVIKIFYDSLVDDGIIHLQIPLSNYDDYVKHSPHYAYWYSKESFISWLDESGFETLYSSYQSHMDDFSVIAKKK